MCLATSGPGAIHLLNGLYDAKLDHQPVVAIVGQQARAALGGEYQQEVDLITLFKDVAHEYVHMATVPQQVRHLIDRAVRIARVERTVTCVIFPNDLQELDYADPPRAHGTVHSGIGLSLPYVIPHDDDLRRAADVLNAGRRVAMLIGAGALGATAEVIEVADLLGAGVAKALLGKAAVPDDLPFVTGSIGLLGTKPSWDLMTDCDTLLMVGSNFPYSEFLPKPGQARGVQIDIDGRMLSIRFPMEVNLIGDAAETLRVLEHRFNLAEAIVGSESTCVLVLDATVRLIPNPRARSLVVLGYPSVYAAADHIPQIMTYRPIGCEGMDDRLVKDIEPIGVEAEVERILPPGGGWLLVEFGGDSKEAADANAHAMMDQLARAPDRPSMKLFDDPAAELKVWKVREAGLGATAHVERDRPTWEGWEDSAVPPGNLGKYLRALRALLTAYGLEGDLYGHFGQGCVHTRINFDLQSAEGIRQYRSFVEKAADLVVSLGGSLSGEHGDGQSRGELLSRMYGPELMAAFREFKEIWDPEWKMNPGKVIEPYRLDEHLRLGADYHPPALQTYFHYPNESGGFAKATLRCVGVGDCRRLEGGTMCPSFRVTREEMHSTRGRARLLFEMLRGDPLDGGWQDEHVKDALDLCLSCKGCKGDCPVSVDMATYKAEFLAHYYERHWRPITAYSFGLIHYWARVASHLPHLVNFVTHTPVLRSLAKLAAGMPRERDIPSFAPETFQHWMGKRPPRPPTDRPRVVLWPDTFNNDQQHGRWKPPSLARKAIVHGHCHQRAIMKMTAEANVLAATGLDCEMLDSGCCGMAGSFGYERSHYDVSMRVGELVLLPAVRTAAPTTLIVADGFSCREQIAQTTGRHAVHLAEALDLAYDEGPAGPPGDFPEERYVFDYAPESRRMSWTFVGGMLLGATAAACLRAARVSHWNRDGFPVDGNPASARETAVRVDGRISGSGRT